MKIKGVIFDLDGVLVSTDEFHYLAWKKIADSLGIPFDRQKNKRLLGVSRMQSLEIVLEGYSFSDEQKAALAAEKNNYYRSMLDSMTENDVDSSVRGTLKTLKDRGLKIAVGSSSKNTKYILEKVKLDSEFDAVADGNDITKSKPDPEVFLKAAQKLLLQPCECLVVEDAAAGIEAGKNGGFFTAGIGPAAGYKGTDYAILRVVDLLQLDILN